MLLPQLKRIRWAVRATLMLGVAASVAANVLHALPNPISQAISAWPPLALLLTVELTSRIPMHKPLMAALRVLATIAIAGIAAWVSYWHMQGVALHYGEAEMSSFLLPISVDGLIVVASVSLVELAGRIRVLEEKALELKAPTAPAPVAPVQFVEPAVTPAPALAPVSPAPLSHAPVSAVPVSPAVGPAMVPPARPLTYAAPVPAAVAATTRPAPLYANGSTPPARPVARPAVSTTRTVVTSPTRPAAKPAESNAPRPRRPVAETARLADEIEAMNPKISEAELAEQLGVSKERLKAIRREAQANPVGAAQ